MQMCTFVLIAGVLAGVCAGNADPVGKCDTKCQDGNVTFQVNTTEFAEGCLLDGLDKGDGRFSSCPTDLELAPVFREPFVFRSALCSESRWRPGLKITWRFQDDGYREKRSFTISLMGLVPRGLAAPQWRKCLQVDMEGPEVWPVGTLDVICQSTCEKLPVSSTQVRIRDARTSKNAHNTCDGCRRAVIHLPDDTDTYAGLPMYFRRPLVPDSATNEETTYPNPIHWTTAIVLHNRPSTHSVDVTFDLAPLDHKIAYYILKLYFIKGSSRNVWNESLLYAKENDTLGHMTFEGLRPGNYYIKLQVRCEGCNALTCLSARRSPPGPTFLKPMLDNPCVLFGGRGSCPAMKTAIFTVANCSVQSTSSSTLALMRGVSAQQSAASSIMLALIGGGLALVFLAGVILIVFIRKKSTRDTPQQDRAPWLVESEIFKEKQVFVVYSMDNKEHVRAVCKLAELIKKLGKCRVVLDLWEEASIRQKTFWEWTMDQTNSADTVLIIGSEGAYRKISARRENKFYPVAEDAHVLGAMFSTAMLAVQRNSPYEDRGRYVAATFEYSRDVRGAKQILMSLTGNNNHYMLMAHLEDLLLRIHNVGKYSPGYIRMTTSDGNWQDSKLAHELAEAISEADYFHKSNPDWFTDLYGKAEEIASGANCTDKDVPCKTNKRLAAYDQAIGSTSLWNFMGSSNEMILPELVPPESCNASSESVATSVDMQDMVGSDNDPLSISTHSLGFYGDHSHGYHCHARERNINERNCIGEELCECNSHCTFGEEFHDLVRHDSDTEVGLHQFHAPESASDTSSTQSMCDGLHQL